MYCWYNVILLILSCIDYSLSTAFSSLILYRLTSVPCGFAIAAWLLQCRSHYVWPCCCCVAGTNTFTFIYGTIMLCCYYNVILPTLSCIDYPLYCLYKTAFSLSGCIASVSCIASIELCCSRKAILAIVYCQCKAVVPLSGYTAHHRALAIATSNLNCLYEPVLSLYSCMPLCSLITLIKLYCLNQAVQPIAVSVL